MAGSKAVRAMGGIVTLEDRTRSRQGPGKAVRRTSGVTLSGPAVERLLSEVRHGVASAHTTGRQMRLVVDLTPRQTERVVELGNVHAVTAPADRTGSEALTAALAEAEARGDELVAKILAGPDMLPADAFAAVIGVSRQTVRDKVRRHEILGLTGATRAVRYPRWQVTDTGQLLPGLPQVFDRLQFPWTVYRFLVQHHPELDDSTALEALRRGEVEAVLGVAENITGGIFG